MLTVPLTFSRGPAYSPRMPAATTTNNYRPWTETWRAGSRGLSLDGPSPVASSVVFDSAGNLTLSIKDRSADQYGAALSSTTTTDTRNYTYIGVGDLLRACADPGGALVLENDGRCGTTSSSQSNNNWGAGGGKFYETTFSEPNSVNYHANTAVGSALQIPGYSTVMATVIDPLAINQDGVRVFGNSDGRTVRGASLTRLATADGGFGKAGGLGDLTTLAAVAPVEIGDRVWLDSDRDGVQGAAETPIAGVTVRLYSSDGAVIATAVTDANGDYYFSSSPGTSTGSAQYGLVLDPQTDYEIRLDNAADFAPTGPLAHLASTSTAAGPNRAVDSNGVRQSPVLVTAPVRTPSSGSADHTFDFGFVPLLSLGNRLWFDDGPSPGHTDNGHFDGDETPVEGARIELLDENGTPVRGADGAPITTTTDAEGFYRFDDLVAGPYRVRVAAANFAAGAVLENWRSSTGASSAFDAASNDRDKGEDASDPGASGVTSGVISLAPGLTGDGDSGATGAGGHGPGGDALDNLTVDFSFVPLIDLTIDKRLLSGAGPYRLGDEVAFELVASNDGPGTALTGFSVSDRLPAGLEFVSASGDSWSEAAVSGAEITLDWLGDDLAAGDVASPVTVTARVTSTVPGSLRNVAVVEPSVAQPTSERVPVGTSPDRYENGSPMPSAGSPSNNDDSAEVPILAPTLSLGNRLWFDTGADVNTDNGRYDVGEQPVVGAIVELLGADGDPILDADGAPVTATTDAEGFYRFDGLAPGQYRVRVAATNFTGTGPLVHHLSSTGASTAFDAGSNSRDKGEDTLQPAGAGVMSALIDLRPGVTGEVDGGATGAGANGPFGDRFDNLTADFGFVPGLSLGNRLWFDAGTGAGEANNGVVDDGEAPVVGAVVELLDAAGNPVLIGGSALTSSTDENGYYRFDGLPPGDYRVRVAASNFTTGAPLQQWFSSSPTSADATANSADKGVNSPTPAITGITSSVVSLSRVNPLDDADAGATGAGAHGPPGDAADLLTVDFGFTQAFAVGDVVWLDDDGDGRRDAEEQPVAGVLVTLMDADGNPVTDLNGDPVPPVRTDADGHYVFDGLPPGVFTVSFTEIPAGLQLTRQGAGDALGDSNPARDGVTPPFVLGPAGDNTTPVAAGDGTSVAQRIDRTIDAGLIPLLAVGDHVWIDANRDGRQDAGETPVAGVTVTLLGADGSPALDADGAPVAPVETDAAGHYVFDGLAPGDYRVRFAGWPRGYHPTVRSAAGVSSTDDSNPDVTGLTPVFTLRGGAAGVRAVDPTDGVSSATRIDPTIDLGIAQDLFAVGDVVWFDADADGRRDAGEGPVPGVTVTLRNADGTPARDWRGAVVAPVKTDADGRYVFDGLLAGDYYALFSEIPAGYQFTASGASGDGDSNPASSGRTPVFSLGPGSDDMRLVTSADDTTLASFIDSTIDAGLVTILPATGGASPIWMVAGGTLLLLLGLGLIGVSFIGVRRQRQP